MSEVMEDQEVSEEIRDDEFDSQEESTEVAEDEQEEQEPQDASEPGLDAEIRSLAQQAGLSNADVEALGSREAIWAALNIGGRLAQQWNQSGGGEREPATRENQTTASESPTFGELELPDDLDADDPLRQIAGQLHGSAKNAFEGLVKRLDALETSNRESVQMQEQREFFARAQQFDNLVAELGDDRFGTGVIDNANSAQQEARRAAFNEFERARQVWPHKSPKELLGFITGTAFTNKSQKQTSPAIKERPKQVKGGASGHKNPESYEDALKRLNSRINRKIEHGDLD